MAYKIKSYMPREIEPVAPYPRINQKDRDTEERRQGEAGKKNVKRSQAIRRFVAMRRLIDTLKQSYEIQRVDYPTADREIKREGLATIQANLRPQLTHQGLSMEVAREIQHQVEDHAPLLQLSHGPQADSLEQVIIPDAEPGLRALTLSLQGLNISSPHPSCEALAHRLRRGQVTSDLNNLSLKISALENDPGADDAAARFQLNIACPAGVMEVDEAGRRAFLYQRPNNSFGLYADKAINLAI